MAGGLDRGQLIAAAGGSTLSALLGAGMGAGAQEMKSVGTSAETIFRGGTILTMVDDRREAAAVAVAGGRILTVGDEAAVMALADSATKIIELNGATLLPSFIDAHGHFMNSPQIVKWANVSGVP